MLPQLPRPMEAEVREMMGQMAVMFAPTPFTPTDPRIKRYKIMGYGLAVIRFSLSSRIHVLIGEGGDLLDRIVAFVGSLEDLCAVRSGLPAIPAHLEYRRATDEREDLFFWLHACRVMVHAYARMALKFGPLETPMEAYLEWLSGALQDVQDGMLPSLRKSG